MSEEPLRRLYDMVWLQEVCGEGVAVPFTTGSMVDDSTATASSCFLVGVAGAIAAAAVFQAKPLPLRFRLLAAGFCGLEGLALAVAGALMALVRPPRGPDGAAAGEGRLLDGSSPLYWLPQLLRLAGSLLMCVLSNQVLLVIGGLFPGPTISWLNAASALLITFCAYAFCSGARGLAMVNGVVGGAIGYGIVVLAFRGKLLKCRALALIVTGLWVRWELEDRCGDKGYADCFQMCPLPYWNNSRWGLFFNHTTTAHLFEAAGLVLFGWSVHKDPDFTTEEQAPPKAAPKPPPVVAEPKEPAAQIDAPAAAPTPAQRGCTSAARSCTAQAAAACAVQ